MAAEALSGGASLAEEQAVSYESGLPTTTASIFRKDAPGTRGLAFVFAVADASRFVAVLADKGDTAIAVTGSAKVGPLAAPAELTAKVSFGSSSNELQR